MPIRLETPRPHVALLTLDEPKLRNALTAETRVELRAALDSLAADPQIQVLVITGAGGHFCAGGDVRTMGETDVAKVDDRMNDVAITAEQLACFPKPVIAAIAGHAAGAGVSLACLADMVVAEETAQFTFSFLKLALGPDWGLSCTLARRVGAAAAKRLILTRATIEGNEAHRLGLADMRVPEGDSLARALDLAEQLTGGPQAAIGAVKAMLSGLDELRAALKSETAQQRARFPHDEHQEGAAAFREKRSPDYTVHN
jgi:2-(1,2-epoxy-1,2-dihydrophenyl)acetyl-CoA isomerase